MKKTKGVNIDFICIGMQKAGTSWLYSQLQNLPEFDNFPIKEIHYFDLNNVYAPTIHKTFFKRFKNRISFKRMTVTVKKYLKGELPNFRYMTNVVFSTYNDNYYKKLFEPYKKIKGDFSPSYSILSLEEIEKMKLLCPDAKIIYIIRNPIERAMSGFKQRFNYKDKKYDGKEINLKEVGSYFTDNENYLRSNAIKTIENYEKIYGTEQFKVFFYDKLKTNPKLFLSEIVAFIAKSDEDKTLKIINESDFKDKKTNASSKIVFSPEVHELLKKIFEPVIKELSIKYTECASWYREYYKSSQP